MGRPFQVGDVVGWNHNGKAMFPEEGVIRKIGTLDNGVQYMYIDMANCVMTAHRVKGRWCAYRSYADYVERIHRIKRG